MIELYSHQREAIKKLRSGSILCGGVGSGKSLTSLAYYFCKICNGSLYDSNGEPDFKLPNFQTDLYIITTARKRDTHDWEQECAPLFIKPKAIDSWNNIGKYVDVENAFFIFDEQRVVGNGAWVKSFYKITKKNLWILLSATPGDKWHDYIPVFVANGFYKNKTEFERRHVVWNRFTKFPKVDRYIETGRLKAFLSMVLVQMPFKRDTVRHYISVPVEYDKKSYDYIMDERKDYETQEPFENIAQLMSAIRKVVNNDPSRFKAIDKILEDSSRVIIFYNFDYELEALRKYCEDKQYLYSEWNGHKHQPIPKTGKWIYLVQYASGAEGWNCIDTNCMIFYSLNYSYRMMEQASGRIDRLNTLYVDLYYYSLISNSSIDKSIKRCIDSKEDFNEKNFASTIFKDSSFSN